MFLSELFEAVDNQRHASFCFGRMNPPTVGHKKLIDTVEQAGQGGDYFIFASQTQDSKKNPLSWDKKINYIKSLFPDKAAHVVQDPKVRTILDAVVWLYNHGYRQITMVAGSDRLPSFQELLPKYNGIEGKNGSYYNFNKINFVSSGERDPDDEGLSGVSASKAREAAGQGNFKEFMKNIGTTDVKLGKNLYNDVRQGMNITEDAAGVGVVATNRKMARDPRYSTSMTVDVGPKTPQKNLRAFRLA